MTASPDTSPAGAPRPSYGQGREQILEAAERLFAENGFSRTTLKDLARASGVNTALVSYYFGGKKGLREAVIRKQLEKTRECMGPILELGERVTVDDYRVFARGVLAHIRIDPTLIRLHLWCLTERNEVAKEMNELLWQPMMQSTTTLIRRLTGGRLPESQACARALLMSAAIQQYAHVVWTYLGKATLPAPRDEVLAEYERLVLNQLVALIVS